MGREVQINERDEVQKFVLGCYLSAPESVWRTLHLPIHKQIPNVERLQVYLPGQHLVVFNEKDNPAEVLQCASQEKTTLTAFFYANADDGELGQLAQQYTYPEFPQHFVYDHKNRK